MAVTKNPFDRSSQGKAETKTPGKAEPKKPSANEDLRARLTGKPIRANNAEPDGTEDLRARITGKPSRAAAEPRKATNFGATPTISKSNYTNTGAGTPSPKSVNAAGGLPPTRKSEATEKSAGPAAAGFQPANPFQHDTPKHPQVSNTDRKEALAKQAEVSWDGKKAPSAPKSHDKEYAERVENAQKAQEEKAKEPLTAENYRESYQAQQQIAIEQSAEQEKKQQQQEKLVNNVVDQQRKRDEAAANAHKARDLQAKMASLQTKLVPNMSPEESYRIHGELEELRVALAQIPYYG